MTTNIGTLIHTQEGKAHIAGTGVTVARIIVWYQLGRTPTQIVDTFGHITLAQVYAALAHYHANRESIDAQIEEEARQYTQATT